MPVSKKLYQSLQNCLLTTDFNLKQEDFPKLSYNVSVRNSVCNPDKPIVKFVCKSIFKAVSTSSVLPFKSVSNSNARSSKLISASSICPGLVRKKRAGAW